MCGIGGFITKNTEKDQNRILEIKMLTTQIFAHIEERGKDASGIYIKGKDMEVLYKCPITSTDMVVSKIYQETISQVNPETNIVLLHTRNPTKGDKDNNNNNHPIVTGNTIGVHNGIIKNDDELFKEYDRIAEVDSEILFHIIQKSGLDSKKLEEEFKKVEGSFAIAAVNRNENKLLLVRRSSPLYICKGDDIIFFASTKDILLQSFHTVERLIYLLGYTMLEYNIEEVTDDSIYIIDNDLNIDKHQMKIYTHCTRNYTGQGLIINTCITCGVIFSNHYTEDFCDDCKIFFRKVPTWKVDIERVMKKKHTSYASIYKEKEFRNGWPQEMDSYFD